MPNRTKSEAPKEATPLYRKMKIQEPDSAVLAKYPQHKGCFSNLNIRTTSPECRRLADLKRFRPVA
jgi:hypothetical protein